MDKEIKFEYFFKEKYTNKIHKKVFTLEELEDFEMEVFLSEKLWTIIARRQYTGLKDKNGKEIYEGDIIKINNLIEKWKNGEPDFDWRILKVFYNQHTWAFENSVLYMPMSKYHDGRNGFYDYEIEKLGNIYESPELLTKSET